MLQVLCFTERKPPVLAERDHVAEVEVVRHDRGVVEQGCAQVEQGVHAVVHATQQHALVAYVAQASVEHGPCNCRDQRSDLLDRVGVGVQGQVDPTVTGGAAQSLQSGSDVVGEPVLR
ncbi:hypothetical protein [Streptomyces inhibens]|uniref:hypothetical protein n=1 Tax=Streptomyces inhibens TaxID=2293571 RepID=UPI001FD610FD|nr:hypothetical protein [Streptomyces inhibens]